MGAKNVKIFKNIKANLEIKNNKIYAKPKEKLIIFASTHKDEEELLLDHFKLEENEKLIIAPRHPERFKEVENLLLNKGLEFEKFSSLKDENKKFSKKILLLDALGELVNFYAISDVVVLGGSFIEGIGGHNPIEAAYFDNVLISGKFIYNQKVLFEEVENVYFCEKLKDLNDKIHYLNLKAKISKKENLDLIIQTIQKGIDARKSL
ncbi:TPA: 3-deoxy-D-manno-octulosonic acid transferase [Campylobacter jejuni]|nr:3-deoxy-D-manno-octulosonic acid transferase [Campylobacter jejuni]HEH5910244.1 3-deoxy-D-manno-octulosonic acid transferase [Campylobacter jejuni]